MFRDDREWLRTRVAELEAELDAAQREIAQLRDQLPENTRAVIDRLVEQEREREREQSRGQVAALQEALKRAEAMLANGETRPSARRGTVQLRRDDILTILVLVVVVMMLATVAFLLLSRR